MEHMDCVVLRGGGDLATGVAQKLTRAGFRLLILETARPTAIRRTVALSEAVYEGRYAVEDIRSRLVADVSQAAQCWLTQEVPVMVDTEGVSIAQIKPLAVVDAILAKRNLGTNRQMAPVTIGLGPGFTAGEDVDAVIETMRGHDLGRLILRGSARPNTGIPGEIGGEGSRRVLRAPVAGKVAHLHEIGDVVDEGEALFTVDGSPVHAPFRGLLRGLIREGFDAPQGMKVADIDPRTDVDWRTISDKARCLGGAVLEAVMLLMRQKG